MTQQRLTQLRGNLANLLDCTDDFRAAVLANWAVIACEGDGVPLADDLRGWALGGGVT